MILVHRTISNQPNDYFISRKKTSFAEAEDVSLFYVCYTKVIGVIAVKMK